MEIIVKRKRLNHHRSSFTFFSSSAHLQTVAPEATAAKRAKNKTSTLKSCQKKKRNKLALRRTYFCAWQQRTMLVSTVKRRGSGELSYSFGSQKVCSYSTWNMKAAELFNRLYTVCWACNITWFIRWSPFFLFQRVVTCCQFRVFCLVLFCFFFPKVKWLSLSTLKYTKSSCILISIFSSLSNAYAIVPVPTASK